MAKSALRWCEAWVPGLPGWVEVAPRGHGVTANLVARQVLLPRVSRRWPDIRQDTRLHEERAGRMLRYLERDGDLVLTLLQRLRDAVDQTMAVVRRRGLDMTVTQVAGRLATALGASWKRDEPLTERQLAAVAEALLRDAVPLERGLTRDEFERYRGLYDDLWERQGRPNLAAMPYGDFALGADLRPPLVAPGPENTFDALGRSVYSRFRLAARDPHVSGDADEVARREIQRACAPLGLQDESARVALRSLNAGLLFGPDAEGWQAPRHPPTRRSWVGDTHPLQVTSEAPGDPRLPVGEGINAGMAARAQAMLASFAARTAQGRMLKLAGRMREAHQDAMARAWTDCFRLDRAGLPVTGERAAGIVSHAIYHGIPSGQLRRARQVERGDSQELLQSQECSAEVRLAVEWLAADQERARALLRGDRATQAAYREAASVYGFAPIEEVVEYAVTLHR